MRLTVSAAGLQIAVVAVEADDLDGEWRCRIVIPARNRAGSSNDGKTSRANVVAVHSKKRS
jgi:hypothetical protein